MGPKSTVGRVNARERSAPFVGNVEPGDMVHVGQDFHVLSWAIGSHHEKVNCRLDESPRKPGGWENERKSEVRLFLVRAGLRWLLAQLRGRFWEANFDNKERKQHMFRTGEQLQCFAQRASGALRKHSDFIWESMWTRWQQLAEGLGSGLVCLGQKHRKARGRERS